MDTNEHELKTILAKGETLTVEFKSDVKGLPDRDLVAAVVTLVNIEGGLILLGVEDDGVVTGVQSNHQVAAGLVALVENRRGMSVKPASIPSSRNRWYWPISTRPLGGSLGGSDLRKLLL